MQKTEEFLSLLRNANKKVNLVSDTDSKVLAAHIEDSLLLSPYLTEEDSNILDLGSGGGFPVIPLAINHPKQQFTAVDSSLRKCDFLQYVKTQLELSNLTVIHSRIENLEDHHQQYNIVTARALKPLKELLPLAAPFKKQDGVLLFLKGKKFEEEIAEAEEILTQYSLKIRSKDEYDDKEGRDFSVVLDIQ